MPKSWTLKGTELSKGLKAEVLNQARDWKPKSWTKQETENRSPELNNGLVEFSPIRYYGFGVQEFGLISFGIELYSQDNWWLSQNDPRETVAWITEGALATAGLTSLQRTTLDRLLWSEWWRISRYKCFIPQLEQTISCWNRLPPPPSANTAIIWLLLSL